jgi:hypothetical protein
MEANFNGEANTIFLDNGIYTGMQLPSIAGPFPLNIIGQEPENTILDGSNQPLNTGFFVAPEGRLTLDRITVKRATVNGIRNLCNISITNTKIDSNTSLATGSGAGISNSGAATITNSTISNNIAFDDAGGGIANIGFMNITNSTIVNNKAGGRVTNGGGIVNIGVLHVVNSTVANNGTAGGPLRGGGIDNFSSGAGGILKIINSTITENSGNSGAGISNGGIVELENTILAFNIGLGPTPDFPTGGPDCGGSLTSLGNNLIGDATDCAIAFQGNDLTGDPGLAAYTENMSIPGSGHYPLLTDSRAIDSGSPDVCPETDQLGNSRVGLCDIGSVEFQGRMLVSIDIRPKKDANRINPNSSKNINVAIFSANGFDATTVDPNTVHFGATGTEAVPVHFTRTDIDGDGDLDMLLRFQIQGAGIKCGDTSATLTGQLSSGLSIIGSSPIKTVQCKNLKV